MLEEAVRRITRGVKIGGILVYAKNVSRGRFIEEVNLDIYLRAEGSEGFLLYIKVFYGRKPYYKPWVEFFGINESLEVGTRVINYYGSIYEDYLLSFFSRFIGPGEKIFVEYVDDAETRKQLEIGIPPAVTRLGYKLFRLGYTWFKDWYFPEGFMEGGQKLQGEKPLDNEVRLRQLRRIGEETKAFLINIERYGEHRWYVARAAGRARKILGEISTLV